MAEIRCLNIATGANYTAVHGDCVDVLRQVPSNSVGFSVYSPPFSGLYIYNDSAADMGNTADDEEFFEGYEFLIREKLRVTMPGRLSAVHCKDLVYYSNSNARGARGLRDFPGMIVAAHVKSGWDFHSRVTIWRCPVREMTKAKPDGLLFKNFRTDAARSRQGLAEYFVVFRKWAPGMEDTPQIPHDYVRCGEWNNESAAQLEKRIEAAKSNRFVKGPGQFGGPEYLAALSYWQEWASPVWMDTRETDVLNADRDATDEKHICPLPLDLSTRAISLWSNPGDIVLSPFMGIGSEGRSALKLGRKFIGIELKESYWRQACKHISSVDSQVDMFGVGA